MIRKSDTAGIGCETFVPVEMFYRALTTRVHVQRWLAREHHSFHPLTPDEWWTVWKSGSTNPADYPVVTQGGVFTERARDAFVELVQQQPAGHHWRPDEQRRIGELAGLCAFDTPDAAYDYGAGGPDGHPTWFVEFTGTKICRAPEDTGWVVNVIERLERPMTGKEFASRYSLSEHGKATSRSWA